MFKLITEYSPWFIIVCLLVGAGYAWLLYKPQGPWSVRVNRTLAVLRFVLVSLLCFLLLGPLVRFIHNKKEKPTVVFALDNSSSMTYGIDSTTLLHSLQSLKELQKKLEAENLQVEWRYLNEEKNGASPEGTVHQLFNFPYTNLAALMNQTQSDYENRNLGGMVLVSDGITNQGNSPLYKKYGFPVWTVGLGDTIPKLDVQLRNLYFNKLSYLGNKFPIVAEVYNKGLQGQQARVSLSLGSQVLETKVIDLTHEEGVHQVEFYHSADKKGMQHYVVQISPVKGEYTTRNNVGHAYIDIIDNKEKILIVALTPHPDIKAIRSALEKKDNYEVSLYIPNLTEFKEDQYELVIFHQVPNLGSVAHTYIDKYTKAGTPCWFILGNQSSLPMFNAVSRTVSIQSNTHSKDQVIPFFNAEFERFTYDNSYRTQLQTSPPLQVPYGEYQLKEKCDVLLWQKVGSIITKRPLLAISTDRKQAVLTGEGIWEWRLIEYRETQDTKAFDKLIESTVQYLSSKEDKRKFRCAPTSHDYLLTEHVYFEAETYNDLYEKIYGNRVDLKITNEKGKSTDYTFVNSEGNSRYEVKGLSGGVYRYTASCVLQGKKETVSGEFTIKELMLEAVHTTADFGLLRQISHSSGGTFFNNADQNKLFEQIMAKKPAAVLHSEEELSDLISLPWLFFILLALATAEWAARKYKGGY